MKRAFAGILAGALVLSLLTGCQRAPEPEQFTTFAMDTVMTVTLAGENREDNAAAWSALSDRIGGYEDLLSVTRAESDIARINAGAGQPVRVDPDTAGMIARALELCEATGGALDITAYPAVKAWGFTAGEHRVPGEEELRALADRIDYTAVVVEGDTVTVPAGMEIDLGAVAKGGVGDILAGQTGVGSALLNLGQSTIVAVGTRPDGTPWRIGVQDPAGESYLAVLELADRAVGTSGGYQRYFEEDGVRYWHILDPETAAPARSGLESVTVVADSALLCDGLSTALFVMGLEEGIQFWRESGLDFEAVFIAEGGDIHITAGLEDSFSPAKGYEDREVTIIRE